MSGELKNVPTFIIAFPSKLPICNLKLWIQTHFWSVYMKLNRTNRLLYQMQCHLHTISTFSCIRSNFMKSLYQNSNFVSIQPFNTRYTAFYCVYELNSVWSQYSISTRLQVSKPFVCTFTPFTWTQNYFELMIRIHLLSLWARMHIYDGIIVVIVCFLSVCLPKSYINHILPLHWICKCSFDAL